MSFDEAAREGKGRPSSDGGARGRRVVGPAALSAAVHALLLAALLSLGAGEGGGALPLPVVEVTIGGEGGDGGFRTPAAPGEGLADGRGAATERREGRPSAPRRADGSPLVLPPGGAPAPAASSLPSPAPPSPSPRTASPVVAAPPRPEAPSLPPPPERPDRPASPTFPPPRPAPVASLPPPSPGEGARDTGAGAARPVAHLSRGTTPHAPGGDGNGPAAGGAAPAGSGGSLLVSLSGRVAGGRLSAGGSGATSTGRGRGDGESDAAGAGTVTASGRGGGEGALAFLRRRIEAALAYPEEARRRNEEGEVLLRIRVGDGGEAREIRVSRSSGFRRLDEAARRGVLAAVPLPAAEGWVEVPVRFSLR